MTHKWGQNNLKSQPIYTKAPTGAFLLPQNKHYLKLFYRNKNFVLLSKITLH